MKYIFTLKVSLTILLFSIMIWSCSGPGGRQNVAENLTTAENQGETTVSSETGETGETAEEIVPEEPVIPDWKISDSLVLACGEPINIAGPVNTIAANLENARLMYGQLPYTDCSGTFHRVLDSLKHYCSDFKYPDKDDYRDSRDLGRWYYEQGEYIRIKDALAMSSYIKPGVVMFYGPRQANIDTLGVEALFNQGGINHVGVVVAVEKDDKGVVTNYSLFHGQRPGKIASTTNYHNRKPSRDTYPPYGNGTEQLVGMAPILPQSVD